MDLSWTDGYLLKQVMLLVLARAKPPWTEELLRSIAVHM